MISKIEDTAALIIRDICEHEPDDTPASVHISVKALELILLERLAAPVVERQPVDDEQWWADTPDGDSALVTRAARLTEIAEKIKALCNHPSMSFHQIALLEGALQSYPQEVDAPPELAELQALSVTNIMLDVVPGDGDGHEVYAKSVADVEAVLTKQCDEIDELQATIARLTAENEANRNEREVVCANYEELKAENERLKGGQGAPVSVVLDPYPIAEAVRTALDRNACPNAWMVMAYEATVAALNTTRPKHHDAPADSGTHPHNDGLDDYREPKK